MGVCLHICMYLSLQEAKCVSNQLTHPEREVKASLTFDPVRFTLVVLKASPVGFNKSGGFVSKC